MKARLLFAVFVVGLFSLGASAQVKKITSAQFSKAMGAAFEASEKRVRSEVKVIIGFENGKIVENSTVTEEFMPPDRKRSHFLEDVAGNKSETEWVIIKGERFKKNSSGKWFKTTPLPDSKPVVTTPKQHAENDKTMKLTSEVKKIGKKVFTVLSRSEISSPNEMPWTSDLSIFVNSEGLITSISQRTSENGSTSLKTEATLYTYDPKDLKIEAPQVN